MSTSVWPADYFKEPHDIQRDHGNHLVVFLLSPFNPRERYDELLEFCRNVCAEIGEQMGARVDCLRADSLSTPNVIHQDIWNYIQMSDAIIADVSDRNGNVMMELGVAASFRDKNQIIIIQDEESKDGFLFDIKPDRHLTYRRSLSGDLDFLKKLAKALRYSLAPAPYIPRDMPVVKLPIKLQLTKPDDCKCLLSPSNSHRRLLSDGLEFGSFHVFRYSWLTLGLEQFRSIRVRAEMRFTELKPDTAVGQGWIGIMLHSQHFYANFGHLIYVVSNGSIHHTVPISEGNKADVDPCLGQIKDFKLTD